MTKNSIFLDFKVKSILFLFFLFCILPFIYIAKYNLPLSDEFVCMYYRKSNSFFEYQQILFNTWSGRYVSNLLEIIYPLNVYYLFYQIIPVFLIILFYLTILLISRIIVNKDYLLFSIIMFLIMINHFPSLAELFYYVPAIIIYTISFFSVLFLIAIWLSSINIKYKIIALIINNIILLGTTELYIPLVSYFSFLLLVKSIKENKLISFYFFNQVIIIFILFYLFTENGNLNRFQIQKSEFDLLSCTYNYLNALLIWTGKFLILIPFIFLLIYLYKDNRRIINFSLNIKWKFIFLLVTGYFLLFAPLFFINLIKYQRTANVFFLYFIVLIMVIFIKIIPKLNYTNKKTNTIILSVICIVIFSRGNVKDIYFDLYHGYSKKMSSDIKSRYQKLEKNKNADFLILNNIPITDYFFKIQDVNDSNDTNLIIDMYKRYYNIDSLIIR